MPEDRIKSGYAKLTMGGVTVLRMKEANVKIDPKFIEGGGGWGSFWEVDTPESARFEVTAKRYNTTGNYAQFLLLAAKMGESNAASFVITLYAKASDLSTIIFQAPVWPGSGSYNIAETGFQDEDITFKPAGKPTIVAGFSLMGE